MVKNSVTPLPCDAYSPHRQQHGRLLLSQFLAVKKTKGINWRQPSPVLSSWLILRMACPDASCPGYLQFLPHVTQKELCIPDARGNEPGDTAFISTWKDVQSVSRGKQIEGRSSLGVVYNQRASLWYLGIKHSIPITLCYHRDFPFTGCCQQNLNRRCSSSMNYSQITKLNKNAALVCLVLKRPSVAQRSCSNSLQVSWQKRHNYTIWRRLIKQ